MTVESVSNKKETKNPPLLFNLAELQNECSKRFKISPDRTLQVVQELYEKKLVTYPRTDARVLSSAIAKEIYKNIKGLQNVVSVAGYASSVLEAGTYKNIAKTKYTNDKQITDHYAIIPTGQGISALRGLSDLSANVYELIARRFLSIFYPPAIFRKISICAKTQNEMFTANFKVPENAGYLEVVGGARDDKNTDIADASLLNEIKSLKKGDTLGVAGYEIKEGETSPPKRYTSGSIILAMENAGQLIEDEDLRAQIQGSGIGTSATRAEILKKLFTISYLDLNKKTQVITPTHLGEMIADVAAVSIRPLLNPELTASWEKGLTYVAQGNVTSDEYMEKLKSFICKYTDNAKASNNTSLLNRAFAQTAQYYKTEKKRGSKKT